MKNTLLLVDGHALIYRAYHAFPKELTSPDGRSTGATFGFCRILFSAIKTLQPTHLAVAFDLPGDTFRHKDYPEYKATRQPAPEDLTAQIPLVHQIVETMEAPIFSEDGYEADDMLGSIAHKVEKDHPDTRVIILSADQDLLQLVTEQTAVYSPGIAPKQPTLFTPEKVQEKYGFSPLQMIEYKALRGDPSDNIPGVPGIGEVTAKQLLEKYHTIDSIYEALAKGDLDGIKPGIQAKLREHEQSARLSHKIATICTTCPITFHLGACRLELQHPEKLVSLFEELRFKSLLSELPGSHKLAATAADVFAEPAPTLPTEPTHSDEVEAELAPILREMERVGVKVDLPYLAKLETEYAENIARLTEELHKEAGQPFNIDSPQQVGFILYDVLKVPTEGIRKGKTGFTTDAETLQKLAPTIKLAELILAYREITKLQSTYVKPLQELADANSRLHTTYAPDAATGRVSSKNPNVQNIPVKTEEGRRIRRAFITEEGWSLVAADYSQIELRIAAHLSGDEALIDAFRKGGDFHTETATRMGVDRRTAKVINFSILYGKGAFGFSNDLGISMDEAKKYIETYFKTFPGLRKYLDQVLDDTRAKGYGETMFGRRRALPAITSSNFHLRAAAEREALNMPIQGTGADILKKAMCDLDARLKTSTTKARMILTVHDELVIECPTKEVSAMAHLLVDTMAHAVELSVPVVVEAKAGINWADMEPITIDAPAPANT